MLARSYLIGAFAALSLAVSAHAATVDFEDAGVPGQAGASATWDGTAYGFNSDGMHFSNADVIDLQNGPAVWHNGVGGAHDGDYAAFNDWNGTISVTRAGGGKFSVSDMWIGAWQGWANTLTLTGWSGGVAVDSLSTGYTGTWSDATVNFSNIDKLTLSGGLFLVDDMTVSTVPEPTPALMLALALGAGLLVKRKRQN